MCRAAAAETETETDTTPKPAGVGAARRRDRVGARSSRYSLAEAECCARPRGSRDLAERAGAVRSDPAALESARYQQVTPNRSLPSRRISSLRSAAIFARGQNAFGCRTATHRVPLTRPAAVLRSLQDDPAGAAAGRRAERIDDAARSSPAIRERSTGCVVEALPARCGACSTSAGASRRAARVRAAAVAHVRLNRRSNSTTRCIRKGLGRHHHEPRAIAPKTRATSTVDALRNAVAALRTAHGNPGRVDAAVGDLRLLEGGAQGVTQSP